MRSGREMFIVFVAVAALVVACSRPTQGGGGTSRGTTGDGGTSGGTTGGGTTSGGTTSGGTSLTGTWNGQTQITVLLQSAILKPPPTDYPGQMTTIDVPCSMSGDLTVKFAQDGSNVRVD